MSTTRMAMTEKIADAPPDAGKDAPLRRLREAFSPDELNAIVDRLTATTRPAALPEDKARLAAALTGGAAPNRQEQALLEAEALRRYFTYRRELLRDCYTSSQVADLLGTSRQTPHDRLRARTLLAVQERGRYCFPKWQFDPAGPEGVVAGLPDVLRARRARARAGQLAPHSQPIP